jgi:uncharacterized protein (DUF58 family)
VGCDVTVVLNLAPGLHVGYKSDSTWELAKDLTLSVIRQQIEFGNSVQFISNSLHVEASRGEGHFGLLSRHLMNLVPEDLQGAARWGLIESHRQFIPQASTVFSITVFDSAASTSLSTELISLQADGAQVFGIFVNPADFISALDLDPVYGGLLIGAKKTDHLKQLIADLRAKGVQALVVDRKSQFSRIFLKSGGTAKTGAHR